MQHAQRVLLVEHAPSLRVAYTSMLTDRGFDVVAVTSPDQALDAHEAAPFDLVLLDLTPGGQQALALLDNLLQINPECAVIAITSHIAVNVALDAVQAGARDFVIKPFDEAHLIGLLKAAIKFDPTPRERATVMESLIGACPKMQEVMARISSVAPSAAPVFLTGQSGTGKELCARAIHALSRRNQKAFIPINCGAIPADLFESELFGYRKGAFAGAIADKVGLAMAADGGTLFLDEICELDLNLQSKLLRFLESLTVTPLGSTKAKDVDVRIICATNRDPVARLKSGELREDLYYRLHVVPIDLPDLKDRGEDILYIAEKTLRDFNETEHKSFLGLSDEVADLFLSHPWPGNVRQLRNLLHQVLVINDGQMVTLDMLPHAFLDQHTPSEPDETERLSVAIEALLGHPLSEVERMFIEATIEANGGSISLAAEALGVSPSTLYRKRDAWVANFGITQSHHS